MPSQTASTSASSGTWAGRSATSSSAIDADPGDLGVVVDGQGAVGGEAHVELDPVGPQPPGLGEGVDGVLGEPFGATPMCKDGGHRGPCHLGVTIPPRRAPNFHQKLLAWLPTDRYPFLR